MLPSKDCYENINIISVNYVYIDMFIFRDSFITKYACTCTLNTNVLLKLEEKQEIFDWKYKKTEDAQSILLSQIIIDKERMLVSQKRETTR